MDTICILKFTKGHYYMKTVGVVMLSFSAHHLIALHICIKFQENILKDFKIIERTHTEIYKVA